MKISNSPIASCLWALACFSTSLVATEAPAPPVPIAEQALELELALAETPNLYLVVHLAERRLEIKARGLVLDTVALSEVAWTRYAPLGQGGQAAMTAQLPVVRTVLQPDVEAVRKVVTVASLTPYPESGATEDAAPAAEAAPTHSPRKEPDLTPPARYRARLDGDWELRIDQDAKRPSSFARLGRMLADQWQRLLGRPVTGSVILSLAMPVEDARRLHHLLDRDATLLVR